MVWPDKSGGLCICQGNHNAPPVVIHKPVPVPHHFREEVNSMLEANVNRGVQKKIGPGVKIHDVPGLL